MPDRPSDANKRFAFDIDRMRQQQGWSLRELADRAQIGLGELEAVLRGDDDVPMDIIILLARAFEVSPGALVDGEA
jgi:transcriptional regulator with XRE-family HTH domain